MNSSLLTADRTTHLKILVVSLIAAIIVMAIAINARAGFAGPGMAHSSADGFVIKEIKPTLLGSNVARESGARTSVR